MGIFNGCLIACDIDGTLMDNGYINPKTVERVNFFLEEGGKFSLSTGRTQAALHDVFASLNNISPSVLANGTVIHDFENDKNLYSAGISDADKQIVKFVMENFDDVGIEIHSLGTVLMVKENEEARLHQKYEHLTAKVVDFETALQYTWNKVLYMFSDVNMRDGAKPAITQKNTDCRFIDSSAVIEGKRRHYYEQIPSGISKASSLKLLCEMLKITKGCFFAIGDYYNDLEMIKVVDISACPENSPEDIKRYATITVSTAENGAVADFIDYLTNEFSNKKGYQNG